MREILVIRFGALGDLCVLGWSLGRLADRRAGSPDRVTLVTKSAFAPLMARMRGIDEVVALDGTGTAGLRRLAARLDGRRWDLVLDAHNILRSHLLCGLLGRRPDARLAKDTVARLAFMTFGRRSPRLKLAMGDRFDEVMAAAAPPAVVPPGPPPLAMDRPPPSAPVLGLAPGAQWDTKRWPAGHYAELVAAYRRQGGGPVRIFLGPREEAWFAGSPLAAVAAADDAVQLIRGASLTAVAEALAGVAVLLTNDSGLLHLAEAVGTPVLALFGPTVREFGYFPLLPRSRVAETDLACRPCSRNGKRPCHRGDLACLERLTAAGVLAVLQEMMDETRVP